MPTSALDNDLLTMTDVEAGYGDAPILRGISLRVRQGLITTLIGANGAGKSTVLRTVFGTLRPTHGEIVYMGEDITRSPSTIPASSAVPSRPDWQPRRSSAARRSPPSERRRA